MTFSFGAGVRDSLSNLAASLGTGRDKASHDAFTVFELGRAQIEAMYRGDRGTHEKNCFSSVASSAARSG